ncbi:DDE-type integrase/transposase/recombinase [Amycolatopsis sp. RM579]|uniref:DDE-type integrase/transposase/recombinase n=1 Tax=Amycolatopsis pithecellobii TaxID=664692 RepID=A0A6N7Z3G9_9PSEU|nr:DDE-type integrase/transposase/recombinase [Amycolatopsis pithecellobii]
MRRVPCTRDRLLRRPRHHLDRAIDDRQRLAHRCSLREVCATHRIRQKFIRPHRPWQNDKVERLNRTVATE